MVLIERPIKPTNDLAELQGIHRRLFEDVYDWAGQIRTVDIRKNIAGAEPFLPVSMIGRSAGYAAIEFQQDGFLRRMSRNQFITRLAYHYDQFNYLHPFREGNGRTQRVFWSRVARDAGWQLDWQQVTGQVNDTASRAASEERDFTGLHVMFDQIVGLATPPRGRDADWRAAEQIRIAQRPDPD